VVAAGRSVRPHCLWWQREGAFARTVPGSLQVVRWGGAGGVVPVQNTAGVQAESQMQCQAGPI